MTDSEEAFPCTFECSNNTKINGVWKIPSFLLSPLSEGNMSFFFFLLKKKWSHFNHYCSHWNYKATLNVSLWQTYMSTYSLLYCKKVNDYTYWSDWANASNARRKPWLITSATKRTDYFMRNESQRKLQYDMFLFIGWELVREKIKIQMPEDQ